VASAAKVRMPSVLNLPNMRFDDDPSLCSCKLTANPDKATPTEGLVGHSSHRGTWRRAPRGVRESTKRCPERFTVCGLGGRSNGRAPRRHRERKANPSEARPQKGRRGSRQKGRVDRPVARAGPPQNRTCAINASGSSVETVHYANRWTIRAGGSGKRATSAAARAQFSRPRWERRPSHLIHVRSARNRKLAMARALPEMP
jgi:hypothetical protein